MAQGRLLGRLVGHVFQARNEAALRYRHRGYLVVRRGKGGADRQVRLEGSMAAYILRRILLMIPTIFGIMAISFLVVQFAPGGPVERVIAQIQGTDVSATARIGGGT